MYSATSTYSFPSIEKSVFGSLKMESSMDDVSAGKHDLVSGDSSLSSTPTPASPIPSLSPQLPALAPSGSVRRQLPMSPKPAPAEGEEENVFEREGIGGGVAGETHASP